MKVLCWARYLLGIAVMLSVYASGCAAAREHGPAPAHGILWSVDWSSDDAYYAVGGQRALWVFDAKTNWRVNSQLPIPPDTARAVHWHPSQPVLAVAGGNAEADEVTGIYWIATNRKVLLRTKEGARGIAWNARGDRVATAGNDAAMQIWSIDGELLHTARKENARSLTGVAWHPSKDIVVAVGEFVSIYDGQGKLMREIRHRPSARGSCLLLCVAWHPSGDFFAVGDYGNQDTGDPPAIQFWSADGQLIKSIPREDGAAFRNISWNADGSLLATASDVLGIWTPDGKLKHARASDDLLWGVAWNNANDRLLTSSITGQVRLWTDKVEPLNVVVSDVAKEGLEDR